MNQNEADMHYDDKMQRHREVMSLLYDSFYQDGYGNWLITPESIAYIFLGEGDKKDLIIKEIGEPKNSETINYNMPQSYNINLEFLGSIINEITQDCNDIKSFNYYKAINSNYEEKPFDQFINDIFETTTPKERQSLEATSVAP